MRTIANECLGSGYVTLSLAERERAEVRCASCGRWIKLRRSQAGIAAHEAAIPRHSRTDPTRRKLDQ